MSFMTPHLQLALGIIPLESDARALAFLISHRCAVILVKRKGGISTGIDMQFIIAHGDDATGTHKDGDTLAGSSNSTTFDSPGSSATFSKRRSLFTSGIRDATRSELYSSTASLPDLEPVLVTLTDSFRTSPALNPEGVSRTTSDYLNSV